MEQQNLDESVVRYISVTHYLHLEDSPAYDCFGDVTLRDLGEFCIEEFEKMVDGLGVSLAITIKLKWVARAMLARYFKSPHPGVPT